MDIDREIIVFVRSAPAPTVEIEFILEVMTISQYSLAHLGAPWGALYLVPVDRFFSQSIHFQYFTTATLTFIPE